MSHFGKCKNFIFSSGPAILEVPSAIATQGQAGMWCATATSLEHSFTSLFYQAERPSGCRRPP